MLAIEPQLGAFAGPVHLEEKLNWYYKSITIQSLKTIKFILLLGAEKRKETHCKINELKRKNDSPKNAQSPATASR